MLHLFETYPWWIAATTTVITGVIVLGCKEIIDRRKPQSRSIDSLIQTTELKGFEKK